MTKLTKSLQPPSVTVSTILSNHELYLLITIMLENFCVCYDICLSFSFDIYSYDEIWSLKCTTKDNRKVKLNKSGVIKKILSLYYNLLLLLYTLSFQNHCCLNRWSLQLCDNIIDVLLLVLLNSVSSTLPP